MAKTLPTPQQMALAELNEARANMRLAIAGIGEPAVEIPMEALIVYRDKEGQQRCIIGIKDLIYVVERVLRP